MNTTNIVPVILAAGDSSRMGYPKALLPFGSRTFLTHILTIAGNLNLPEPCVVLGRHADRIQPIIGQLAARVMINDAPERGQISSIQLALSQIRDECAAALVWPVDQPAVSQQLIARLVDVSRDTNALVVVPRCRGRGGHPAIFNRDLFSEILEQQWQMGLKEVVLRHWDAVRSVETGETAIFEDIDTPEDYFRLTGTYPPAR